jgi:hypothetical protein
VLEAIGFSHGPEFLGAIGRSIVCQQLANLDALGLEVQKRSLEKGCRGALLLVRQHLHVAGPGVVIVADVKHLIARLAILVVPDACGSVAHLIEVGQLLGVEVEEVAWSFVLIAVRRLLLLEGRGPGNPCLPQPEPHGGPGHAQLRGDPDRRLAPPPSTYGLDDEAKLVASRQTVGLAGAIPQASFTFVPESLEPLVAGPFAESGQR